MARSQIKALVVGAFISLGSLIKLTQHGARALKYNFLCPIIVISLAKLVSSAVLYRLYDGPLDTIPSWIRLEPGVALRYGVVAALFCLYDVLSFVNLAHFDPQTYLVFLQMRTVLTGMVWEVAFGKSLAWAQRGGLALICAGCVMKQIGAGFDVESLSQVSLFDYAILALQITSNCLAGVANELLLKRKGGAPLNLQNMIQYSWTVLWCLCVGAICPLDGVHLNPFNFEEWAKMGDSRMLPNIVILTVLGLVTSVLLKLMDSVWKAIATAVELFLTSYASALVFGYPVSLRNLLALCVAACGIGFYTTSGKAAPNKQLPTRQTLAKDEFYKV